jgi:hypothetical protein
MAEVTQWDAQGKPLPAAPASTSGTTEWDAGGKPIVPGAPPPDMRSLLQTAKDNFNAATQGAKPGDGAIKSFVENVGAGGGDVIRSIGHAVLHPLDTAAAVQQAQDAKPFMQKVREAATNAVLGPAGNMAIDTVKGLASQPGRTIGQVGTGAILGEAAAPVVGAAIKVVPRIPGALADAVRSGVGGSKLDEIIPGDTVTPRQRYNTAVSQGVNLDTAQATGSPLTVGTKRVTEHSLGGSSKFEANNAANVQALQSHSQQLLDTASPTSMSREDFGNMAKQELVKDQQALNSTAGDIYKSLDAKIGGVTPDATPIRDIAQKIVSENKAYYEAHPELLSGGDARAWKIVNNLAKDTSAAPKPKLAPFDDGFGPRAAEPTPTPHKDTWTDLHNLRSDLLDITRGPDMVGERPTGWIKQLTGAVDDTMMKAGDAADGYDFREANDIYKYMKQTYDDPTSRLYHVVRSPDGLTAANTLANITPDVARKIGAAAPDLVPQLQRQAMSRILSPAGNELPDLQNLSSRLSRAQKEQLNGVLTPEQIKSLDDLGRTSRMVTFDSNAPGSGKVAQRAAEGGAIGYGLMKAGGGAISGNPMAIAEGLAPIAYTGAQRLAASKLTNPAFTESIMNGGLKGQAKWAAQGEAKLLDYVASDAASTLTSNDISALSKTPQGKSLLVRASSLTPGSPAMKNLIKSITSNR